MQRRRKVFRIVAIRHRFHGAECHVPIHVVVARNDNDLLAIAAEKTISEFDQELVRGVVLPRYFRCKIGGIKGHPLHYVSAHHDSIRRPDRRAFPYISVAVTDECRKQLWIGQRVAVHPVQVSDMQDGKHQSPKTTRRLSS